MPLRYVETLNEARTPLAACFSLLPDGRGRASLSGRGVGDCIQHIFRDQRGKQGKRVLTAED